MHAFHTLLLLLAVATASAYSQQPKTDSNIPKGESIEDLRKIAVTLDASKGSFEFVEAAYASGRDDVVALCWSVRTCGSWCYERLQKNQDPAYRDKQMLLMLRNSGANSWWPDGGGGLLNGAQAMVMETLGRMLKDYFPVWINDYSMLDSPEKRRAFADQLEVLIKAKQQQSAKPAPSPAPAAVVPSNPAPTIASPPKSQLSTAAPSVESSKSVGWTPWVSVATVLVLIAAFLVLRGQKK